MSEGYTTLQEAVYHAAYAARNGDKVEQASLVYYHEGRYYFTEPANDNGRRQGDKFRVTARFPKGARPVYYVHNHPDGDDNHRFSPDDLEVSHALGLPSAIIYSTKDGQTAIRTFTPGRSRVSHGRTSLGDSFDWTPQAEAELVATAGAHNTLVE